MAASVAQATAFLAANPLFAFATLAALPIALWLLRDYLLRFPLRAFPSPPGIPLIGHVHYLLSKPWEAFARFAAQYGKVYVLRLWSKPFLVISDPELVKRVFQDEKRRYVKDQWSYDYFRSVACSLHVTGINGRCENCLARRFAAATRLVSLL